MTKRKKYDAQYFIDKFKNIPHRNWITKTFHDEHGRARCALGHCGAEDHSTLPTEAQKLVNLFEKYLRQEVTSVNDFYSPELKVKFYKLKNPRNRILSALIEIKRLGG